MNEPRPLATIQRAVLEFLCNRTDAVLFGTQAVNAYVDQPRMTQDVDILSNRAQGLAEEIRALLAVTFRIASEFARRPPARIPCVPVERAEKPASREYRADRSASGKSVDR